MTTAQDQQSRAELLPCPFCGGSVEIEETDTTSSRRWWGVVCRNTTSRGGTCAIQQRPSASIEAAVERWNRRVPAEQAARALPAGDKGQDEDIEWRPVLRHEEDYEVSNKGDLRNKKTGLIQAKNRMGAGYVKADLHRGGTRTQTSVHRLVAQAFLRPGRHGEQVNHINGVKTDNRVENLEWVSKSENEMHSRYHLGNLCKPVIATCLETGESLEFASMDMAAKHTSVYRSGVGKCVRGEIRSAKGWTFQLKAKEAEESFTASQVLAMGRVPPGWQAVPVERTEEMKRAAMELLLDGLDIYVNGQDQIVIETDAPRRLWKAFLAAAPRPPAAQEGA